MLGICLRRGRCHPITTLDDLRLEGRGGDSSAPCRPVATMTLVSITDQFAAASDVLDLARALGVQCLEHGGLLRELSVKPEVQELADPLEAKVAAIDPRLWLKPGPDGTLAHMLDAHGLRESIELAETCPPVEFRAVLRGLCKRAIPRRYLACEGRVLLDHGSPVQLVSRPINTIIDDTTPHHTTMTIGHPLEGLAHSIYPYSAGDTARVELDFSHRRQLDVLTWNVDGKLPRIATLHPFLGAQNLQIAERTPSWFFGVAPVNWDLERILEQLRLVADIEIAVLPELCLPFADALEDALELEPDNYPSLIVAGSAHVRENGVDGTGEIRANESRTYLSGKLIGTHRKIHPFKTKHLAGHELKRSLMEGLTAERKTIVILSGEHTRLATVICADLNDEKIPLYLQAAHVNFLLVPALTGGAGAFNGAVCTLASQCQAGLGDRERRAGPPSARQRERSAAIPRDRLRTKCCARGTVAELPRRVAGVRPRDRRPEPTARGRDRRLDSR